MTITDKVGKVGYGWDSWSIDINLMKGYCCFYMVLTNLSQKVASIKRCGLLATNAVALCAALFSTALHAEEKEVLGPVLEFSMAETLGFTENQLHLESDKLGDWSVQGIVTGLSFHQTNPVSSNGASYSGFSNAQVIVQKKDGPIRLFAQTGLYSIPTLGTPFMRAEPQTVGSFGYLPQAFVSIVPGENWSIALGKLPSMGGVEATFTYENPNIQRGLLWVQTNSVSRGMQVNYEDDLFTAAFTWNDGAYSDVYNWLGGLVSVKPNERSILTASWTGSVWGNATNNPTTQLLSNNSQISNLIYQYTGDRWTVTPYLQYTNVPANTAIGINGSSGTYGGSVITTYHVTPLDKGVAPKFHVSIPTRFEYQSTYGNSQISDMPAGLMYGAGSSAWSATLTPTVQWGKVFGRFELGYVRAFNMTSGLAFGANGMNSNQTRVMLEAGVLY